MIRYAITKQQIEQLIETEKPGWLANAAVRTDGFRQKGFYQETSTIWSQIKAVYMRLQGNGKCAYCEREMESVELGKVEQDVEHFRPKGNIKAWQAPQDLLNRGLFSAIRRQRRRGIICCLITPLTTRPPASRVTPR